MAIMAPSLADIERLALAAMARLPPLFRRHLDSVLLRIEDFPDEEVMATMGVDSPFDLLGLYHGHHVGDPGGDTTGAMPTAIYLYRRPILDVWAEGEESLERLVTHVLVHEVGHHFGLSDADIDAIEASVPD
jgi:predicted Zn-dependent protease with MMP-like domain